MRVTVTVDDILGEFLLSRVKIDVDKDWADRSINHLHSISIQPDLLPDGELDTILIEHSDKTFKTLFYVFTDAVGVTHTQNFLKFGLSDYDLLLGIEHVYKRAPLPIDYYRAILSTGLDTEFTMNSLGITAYNGFTVYGSYNSLTTPDLEFDLSTNAELVFYGENQNAVISGRSTDLFRVQDMGDPEKHVVNSIYHDNTLNLDVVGTRWAMRIGEVDYHLAVGQTYDVATEIMHTGIVSSHALEIQALGGDITLNPSGVVDFSQKQSKNHVLEQWTTTTRPSNPVEGQIGYNTNTHQFEGWNGSSWVILG
jgi:hypothetical protein